MPMLQNHEYSCGPACLAIISEEREEKIISLIFSSEREGKALRTTYPQLIHALGLLKFKTDSTHKPFKNDWKNLGQNMALLRAHYNDPEIKDTHWLVYDPVIRKIHDPEQGVPISINKAKRLFTVKSFINIYGRK